MTEQATGGPADRERIDIAQANEITYWTGVLNVTKEQLVAAVQAVGPALMDVKRQLGLI